jgi:hypothetical protein
MVYDFKVLAKLKFVRESHPPHIMAFSETTSIGSILDSTVQRLPIIIPKYVWIKTCKKRVPHKAVAWFGLMMSEFYFSAGKSSSFTDTFCIVSFALGAADSKAIVQMPYS